MAQSAKKKKKEINITKMLGYSFSFFGLGHCTWISMGQNNSTSIVLNKMDDMDSHLTF